MKIASGVLGIALVLMCGNDPIWGQAAATPEKSTADTLPAASKVYRVTYTITETDGVKRLGVQHFAFTVNSNSGDSQIKLGSRVPVITGAYNQGSAQEKTEVTYLDVGLHISARLHDFSNGEQISTQVDQTSLGEEPSPVGKDDPIVRQATLNTTALLNPGKPVVLGSLDIPGSTRHLEIEVVLEVIR